MGSIRRLYLYAVSLISLGLLASGVYQLLAVAIEQAIDLIGPPALGGPASGTLYSLALSLIIVAGPIYAIHWWLVVRGLRGAGEAALEQRRSAIRALYFALLLISYLAVVVVSAYDVLRALLHTAFGLEDTFIDFGPRLAALIIAGLVWAYHFRLRSRELRATLLSDAASWLTRLYRYAAAVLGLFVGLAGVTRLVTTLLEALVEPGVELATDWWQASVVDALALAGLGFVVWFIHWRHTSAVQRDAERIGEQEWLTRLRAAYFGLVVLVGAGAAAGGAHAVLTAILGWAFGGERVPQMLEVARLIVGPIAGAAPFAIAGWLHHRRRVAELATLASPAPGAMASARRLSAYLVALLGLGFLAAGSYQVLDELFHLLTSAPSLVESQADMQRLAGAVAALLVGGVAWLPSWSWIARRRAEDAPAELRSIASRIYLYLVIGASLIAFVPSAALIVYRSLDSLIGRSGGGMADELATPLAAILVSGVVAAYHGLVLRNEQRVAAVPATAEPATAAAAEPATVVQHAAGGRPVEPLALGLTLRAPAGTDMEAAVDALRRSLPAGASLDPDAAPAQR